VHGLRVSGLLRDTRAHAKQGIGGVNLNTAMRRALIHYDGIESHGLKCDIGGTCVLVRLNSQRFRWLDVDCGSYKSTHTGLIAITTATAYVEGVYHACKGGYLTRDCQGLPPLRP
jgi:hypothetical protein